MRLSTPPALSNASALLLKLIAVRPLREYVMTQTGGCYCGEVRYETDAVQFKGQCHCQECQYISGGAPNMFMVVPSASFRYTKGSPKTFARQDIDSPGAREFCGTCGTHLTSRPPGGAPIVIVKIGTLDNPAAWGGPNAALWVSEAPPYHHIPQGVATFPKFPT